MKLPIVAFTAFVAFATVHGHGLPDFGEGQLHEDIQYFLDFIPMKKVSVIVMEYISEDEEFQQFLEYVKKDDFKTMIKEVEAIPEFVMFADYLEKNGVHIYNVLNNMNKGIGLPPFHELSAARQPMKITGGLKGLFYDIKQYVNYDDFIRGYVFKLRISDAWRDFVKQLKSENNQKFVNTLYENVNFLQFRGMIAGKGVDCSLVEDIIYIVLGIEFPVFSTPSVYADSQLANDLEDFIKLIDMNKVMEILLSYVVDDEVHRAFEFMYSEKFHELVRQVEALPEYQDLVRYLEDSGLDMPYILQAIHRMIDMEDYVPPAPLNGKRASLVAMFINKGGLRGLVNDVVAILPLDKLKALYEEKMRDSPAFKNFIERLQSPDFQKIINTIYSSPVFLDARRKVIADGVNLEPIRDLIEKGLGIHLPRPSNF